MLIFQLEMMRNGLFYVEQWDCFSQNVAVTYGLIA